MPNASRESAASDRPRTTNSRKCDRSRTLTAGILQIAVDAKAVRRCALTLPGMTAIEHLHDNPPFPVIERATTLVRKRPPTRSTKLLPVSRGKQRGQVQLFSA